MESMRSKIKRIGRRLIGNYDVFPDTYYFQPRNRRMEEDVVVLDEITEYRFFLIKRFIEERGLEVVGKEGAYLYLKGDRTSLDMLDSPLVLVDEIPAMYQADKAYYKKHGFFSHMKVLDTPYIHSCTFEMRTMGAVLDFLLEDKVDKAIDVFKTALEELETGDVSIDDLLFYNKSKARHSALVSDSTSDRGDIFFVEYQEIVHEPLETPHILEGKTIDHTKWTYLKREKKEPEKRK